VPKTRILLIDDDEEFSDFLSNELRGLNYDVVYRDLAEDGLRLLTSGEKFNLVLLDNKMPGMTGLDLLEALAERRIVVGVILMTSAHNDRTAIQAIKQGAYDYVIKPLAYDDVMRELGPVIAEAVKIFGDNPPLLVPPPDGCEEPEDDCLMIGTSKVMIDVLKRIGHIGRLIQVDEPVLILGETGTGKDLVARAIHANSPRQNNPLVVLNCAALNDNLLQDELFGHEARAFTGADKLRKGRFEHADGGTLFLDEVGDMPMSFQLQLLRVLGNREVVRVGSNDPIKVDVFVVAATHRDLKALVREGKFREDLYFRLDGLKIRLPALRERCEDVEPLARRFLSRMFGGSPAAPRLHPAALEALRKHAWPGNVRQLQKVLSAAARNARGSWILREHLEFDDSPSHSAPQPAQPADQDGALASLRGAIQWAWASDQPKLYPLLHEHLERELLRFALAQGLSEVKIAERLGMARNTVRDRLKKYGLKAADDGA
jgi:two-component system, NtrC family, nitrogen regulation response regulator GlnG